MNCEFSCIETQHRWCALLIKRMEVQKTRHLAVYPLIWCCTVNRHLYEKQPENASEDTCVFYTSSGSVGLVWGCPKKDKVGLNLCFFLHATFRAGLISHQKNPYWKTHMGAFLVLELHQSPFISNLNSMILNGETSLLQCSVLAMRPYNSYHGTLWHAITFRSNIP